MKTKFLVLFILLITSSIVIEAQGLLEDKNTFTRQDTLRGTITPERVWWDVTYYHLDIKVDPDNKYISGKNLVQYKVLKPHNVLQIDLQNPLEITKVTQNGKELKVKHDGNAHFITLKDKQVVGDINSLEVHYKGNPKVAKRAPWDGGFSWKKDDNGKHFVATSCQGLGASVWWPNKDHMYDEVDSMLISVNVPKGLSNVSNGRLRSIEEQDDNTVTSHWFVNNPINNYGVNVNIGDYVHFSEVFKGENGDLDLDYFVLRDNLEKAKEHFKDTPKMMKAFEHWFGPYPFYEDGFKLVEVPYLGMEHQSSITYGNKYMKGYLGNDLSKTGWGLKFDFIIIHEAGHEWFANNITYKDIADMWIHEGFTAYSEGLYLEYHYNKQAGDEYTVGKGKDIKNDRPIIGYYNVNKEGSGDMYNKGAYMIHTLRQLIEDDEKWRMILRGLNKTFYHQTVTTKQVEDYLSKTTGIDLTEFFNQYLRDVRIPTLEYEIKNNVLKFRYTNIIENFDMPIKIHINGSEQWLFPKAEWQTMSTKADDIKIDDNFLVYSSKL
ncbi:M1 family metallopeptidase [Flavobacteriaceae bacterium S0825]|uniref:M1 family metallopeptidase n=1 Tax=Gaetbulibacter sp. S0825 TaxID=2720084 RepID=UPI00142FBBAD|nr:M1 family metallopeptidase [Gaetbulibacter sp. S0825]MCK0109282.1 M1 family metallopeptidase [Flavobacteriaceae bacterium S0825]NIX64916.1 M1 family metallopeptidase [Gaetbulibacter sp. S0825]